MTGLSRPRSLGLPRPSSVDLRSLSGRRDADVLLPQRRPAAPSLRYLPPVNGAALSVMFLLGGLTMLVCAALAHGDAVDERVLVGIGVAAPLVGAALWLRRRRLPVALHGWLVTFGTVLLTGLIASSGRSSVGVSFSFFFTWVVLYSVLFLEPRQVALQLVLAAAGYVAGFALSAGGLAQLSVVEPLVLVSVVGTFGIVVELLARALEASETDPLTRTFNRRGMERVLQTALDNAADADEDVVLALIDVDDFKIVNDRRGHLAGDQVLQDLADAWRTALRGGDILCRVGGDEFLAVLPGCAPADAASILRRLRDDQRIGVTCSIGAAAWHPGDNLDSLLASADDALYEAKRQGRDRIAWARGGAGTSLPDTRVRRARRAPVRPRGRAARKA